MRMVHDSELRFLVNCRWTLAGLRTDLLCCWPGWKIFFDVDGQAAKFSSKNLIFRLSTLLLPRAGDSLLDRCSELLPNLNEAEQRGVDKVSHPEVGELPQSHLRVSGYPVPGGDAGLPVLAPIASSCCLLPSLTASPLTRCVHPCNCLHSIMPSSSLQPVLPLKYFFKFLDT